MDTRHEPTAGAAPGGAVVLSAPKRRINRRTRHRLWLGLQYSVFLAVVAVVAYVADWQQLRESFFRLDIAAAMWPDIIVIAFFNTIIYTLLAFVFGLVFGTILALMRLSSVGPYRWFATGYIEFFRGLPALLVLFLVGYGIPIAFQGYVIAGGIYGQVMIGLGLTAAAYMAETIRAGIQAVARGQLEAARTLGMSYGRAMFSIVMPQALRIVIPPLTNEIILLTKDTSLVFALGVTVFTVELTKFSRDEMNTTVNVTPLIVAGLLYLAITLPLSQVVRWLEVRAAKGRR